MLVDARNPRREPHNHQPQLGGSEPCTNEARHALCALVIEPSGRDTRGFVFLVLTHLSLASWFSTLVVARRAPMTHDVFDYFKKHLIGGWEE